MASRALQRHDQFFQALLDRPGAAGTLLRERLPPAVAALLADEPPELVPASFISKRLRGYRADRLYKARTRSGRPALIYTLIEHKSAPDPRVALQLLGYQHQILEHWARTAPPDQPLPAVISLVVHHGRAPWTAPLSLAELTDADDALRPYLLDFRYALLDLRDTPDADLSQERALRVGLLILKHGVLRRADRRQILKIAREAEKLGDDDLAMLFYYLLGDVLDDPRGDLIRGVLRDVAPDKEDRVMSLIAQQWKEEGFNLGVVSGRTEGRSEGRNEGKAELLLRQMRRRFHAVPPPQESRVRAADADQLDLWSDRIFDATSLDDLLDDPKPN